MLCNATLRSTSHCITCINICQMLIQFEIFSGDELNKPMASVQILLLLYTTYSMYITCVIEIKYVYTKTIYSDRFIWYEKAFLTCPMDLVSNRKSVICIFVQVSPASYKGQRYTT